MKKEKKQFEFSLNKEVISSMANSQPTNLAENKNQLIDTSTCQYMSCHDQLCNPTNQGL